MKFSHPLLQAVLFALLTSAILPGCSSNSDKQTIRIAEQYGLAYAPLQLIRLEKKLEKAGIKPEWVRLINTASIREAMLAGRVDIGFMGIPPFLIGRENGMDWRIFTGLCRAPLGLVTLKKGISTIRDLGPKDRIALPQPGSIQHILLSMAAETEFGQSGYFDTRLVTLSHPDGMSALTAGGDITAHFTSPPYLFEELKLPGAKLVIDGEKAFGGPFTFIAGVSRREFAEKQPDLLNGFLKVLQETVDLFETDPASTVPTLKQEYSISPERLKEYLNSRDLVYETEIRGTQGFQIFMHKSGLLKKPPLPDEELFLGQFSGRTE